MKDKKQILKRIKDIILNKEPSAKIYLYGSRARSKNTPDSD
ncbi:MAG: nucleotidyltransferase domain-containing protein [Bacteroidetes bacterium]|nr:MAG: nucleotidyltransferase domain-containing protein [Bacteroidota bacterium]